jgi:hypothetical protein
MNCPVCLSVMYCASEIHKFGQDEERMDLHCFNRDCLSRNILYSPHMGVITHDPNPWRCYNYHLPIWHKDHWYYLEGEASRVIMSNVLRPTFRHIQAVTRLKENKIIRTPAPFSYPTVKEEILVSVDFIPLSTSDDMHEQALHLFHRLMKLVIFS